MGMDFVKKHRTKKFVIDTSELDALLRQIEGTPIAVRRHIKNNVMPVIGKEINQLWKYLLPSGKSKDKAKRSTSDAGNRSIASAPKLKTTVDFVVRDIGRTGLNLFSGPTYPDGNKINFDYHGETDRLMSFWAKKGHPTRYRARKRQKRFLAKIVFDFGSPVAIRKLREGVAFAVEQHMSKKSK